MPDTYAPMVLVHTAISAMVVVFTQLFSVVASSSNLAHLTSMLESFMVYAASGLFFGFLYAVTNTIVTLIAYRKSAEVDMFLKNKFLSNLKSFSCTEISMDPSSSGVAKLSQDTECASSSKNNDTTTDVKEDRTGDDSSEVKHNNNTTTNASSSSSSSDPQSERNATPDSAAEEGKKDVSDDAMSGASTV